MINPFVSIDEQLSRIGWIKFYECQKGFGYVKHIGDDIFYRADFDRYGIQFYDPCLYDHDAISVTEVALELFAAKIKEWRRQYGRNTEGGRHFSEKCS